MSPSFGMELKQEDFNELDPVEYQIQAASDAESVDMKLVNIILEHQCPKKISRMTKLMTDYRKNHNVIPSMLLLHGESGIGKSTIARGIAAKANLACLFIDCLELDTQSVSVNLRKKVEAVMKGKNPYVIVFDEIGTILARPKGGSRVGYDATKYFLNLTEELCTKNPYACIIGTTNTLNSFPQSTQDRFDDTIEISYPDAHGYEKIVQYYVDKMNFGCDEQLIKTMAESVEGHSGRTIKQLVKKAGLLAYGRVDDSGPIMLTSEDFLAALKSRAGSEPEPLKMKAIDNILKYCPTDFQSMVSVMVEDYKSPVGLPPISLLHGQPGTGKSTVARGIAEKAKIACIFIECTNLGDAYQNSASGSIDERVEEAMNSKKPYIIVLDEVGTMLGYSKNSQKLNEDATNYFLGFTDELRQKNPYARIIGTTNTFDTFSQAAQDRFAAKFEIHSPSEVDGYKDMIRCFIDQMNFGCNDKLLTMMAKRTMGYSGRLIEVIVQKAGVCALDRIKSRDSITLSEADFFLALKKINIPSPLYARLKSGFTAIQPYIYPTASLLLAAYGVYQQSQFQQEQLTLAKKGIQIGARSLLLGIKGYKLAKLNTKMASDNFVFQALVHHKSSDAYQHIPEDIKENSAEYIQQLKKHDHIKIPEQHDSVNIFYRFLRHFGIWNG